MRKSTPGPLPASRNRMEAILGSPASRNAALEHIRKFGLAANRESAFTESAALEAIDSDNDPVEAAEELGSRPITEAIVLLTARPPLLVTNGIVAISRFAEVEKQLQPLRRKLRVPIGSVGRVELSDHDTHEWCGTAWRIEEDLLVTNRHVARIFAEKHGPKFRFRTNVAGKSMSARIDFREEYRVDQSHEIGVAEVLWIADDNSDSPDMAILRLKKTSGIPEPLQIAERDAVSQQWIGVVGYPARDGQRNDPQEMAKIFENIYDVKRFSPGKVDTAPKDSWFLTHECTTMGGNSGSPVLDLDSQRVVGLHFGGKFRKTNYAVKASVIRSLVRRRAWTNGLRESLHIPTEAFSDKSRSIKHMADRDGYSDSFLGLKVRTPKAGSSHKVLKTRFTGGLLPYTHFSILMSKERRLPIFTAENIDGAKKIKLKRKDAWGYDPRLDRSAQLGHFEFYGPAPFDKGHMVRRENAGWGDSEAEARLGEEDTFVYTNAVPQMPALNQKTWLSLENYVLENTRTHGFKVAVFTGPVLDERDPEHHDVQVPERFWKVVVAIDADDRGQLLSSGYLLSQEGFMPEEGFRFGAFKTYQVPLKHIAEAADLKFDKAIMDSDVFSPSEAEAISESGHFVEINDVSDIVLTSRRRK